MTTSTETTTDTAIDTAAIDNYVAAWNETDDAKHDELLAASVSPGPLVPGSDARGRQP